VRFLVGVIVGIALAVGGAYYYLTREMPVATKGGPVPLERFLAGKALEHAMGTHSRDAPPMPASEANLLAGVNVYRTNCDGCHGLPQQKPPAVAKGMYPRPPQLFSGDGVTDDPPGETHWKVANGIRLSGMPGFAGNLSDDEMWQVTLLLAHAKELPDRVRRALH
jgi:mono/diheme cytochrome c family protein